MARGLSELQRFMLVEALKGHESEHRHDTEYTADLLHSDVLVVFYGIPRREYADKSGWMGWQFSPTEIGKERYESARAAASRARTRLEHRGLVTNDTLGINLTESGIAVAKTLSVTVLLKSGNL